MAYGADFGCHRAPVVRARMTIHATRVGVSVLLSPQRSRDMCADIQALPALQDTRRSRSAVSRSGLLFGPSQVVVGQKEARQTIYMRKREYKPTKTWTNTKGSRPISIRTVQPTQSDVPDVNGRVTDCSLKQKQAGGRLIISSYIRRTRRQALACPAVRSGPRRLQVWPWPRRLLLLINQRAWSG